MQKLKLDLKEFLEYRGMKKCIFVERSGVSAPVIYKVLSGGDYSMSIAKKIIDAGDQIICPMALLKAIKKSRRPKGSLKNLDQNQL